MWMVCQYTESFFKIEVMQLSPPSASIWKLYFFQKSLKCVLFWFFFNVLFGLASILKVSSTYLSSIEVRPCHWRCDKYFDSWSCPCDQAWRIALGSTQMDTITDRLKIRSSHACVWLQHIAAFDCSSLVRWRILLVATVHAFTGQNSDQRIEFNCKI